MNKKIIKKILVLIVIIVISSGCIEESASGIKLENHNGGYFSLKKPAGWEVIPAGQCSTWGILVRDINAPENQIFFFSEFGPVYLTQEQKNDDIIYMNNGGYYVPWIEMPVVNPLTPENFLKQFHLAAQTNAVRGYMKQMPVMKDVNIISSRQVNAFANMNGDTKIIRASFTQNGKSGEGLFYVTTAPLLPGNIGYGYVFIGIASDKDHFRNNENKLLESVNSISLSKDYLKICGDQQKNITEIISATSEAMTR